jgi:Carboxypeptidase regulatory-like domain/TonB dependent receptor
MRLSTVDRSFFSARVIARTLMFTMLAGLATAGLDAQELVGSITGTIKDASGAAVPGATVKALNSGTNLEVIEHTDANGSFLVPNLPAGNYKVTFTKEGFETESHAEIIVNGGRTTTVDGSMKVGQVSETVEVTAVPLMNQVDTTNGYVVDQLTIQDTPLGTGSFTQLAILSPGVHADFLGGGGSNAGLGNQAIIANGQRSTSNSFSLNGVSTNNIFNGNSTSQVGENRFILNTGENFGLGGTAQTSTSVFGAIGQALPTPAPETIQEIAVNTSMYDASQGANSGAHISVITKTGTNEIHGEVYEHFQNSDMNAAPFFYNANPTVPFKVPFLARNAFGGLVGGPIKKNKVFYFLAYQGVRIADGQTSTTGATVPITLTNDRSMQGIINTVQADYGTALTTNQINPVALAILQAKLPNGNYLIPTPTITNIATAKQLGYDALQIGPNTQAQVNQGSGNIDYNISDKDRFTAKYYIQSDPTTTPFAAVTQALGFPQTLKAGSQVVSLDNTTILTPTLIWEQRAGYTRMAAYATTNDGFTPSQFGINLPAGAEFPEIEFSKADNTLGNSFTFGANPSFGNAGMYQNNFEGASTLRWILGKHSLSFGVDWNHTQLNIINNNTNSDIIDFSSFVNFVEGSVRTGTHSTAFLGSADRYYRSDTGGAFVNDNYKLKSNLTVTLGLRWDLDGALSEKYGRLTGFNSALYSYNASTDTITGSGLEIAGNNPTMATSGASNTLMQNPQWGFAPRIGIAWNPIPKLTVRTGFGIYYDRGELFSYLSAGAGGGFSGPFGVTLSPPFVSEITAGSGSTFANPFPSAGAAIPGSPAAFLAQLPNLHDTANEINPAGNLYGPFIFSGYDITNKLPYTENWTFDLQYQLTNSWMFTAGYTGNHGNHLVVPVTFNQPLIATPTNPVNGQTSSYGYTYPSNNALEPISTLEGGNTGIRVPYIGYSANSVIYEAEGISNYDALMLQVRHRLSKGLLLTGSYTWSHALDNASGSGAGLFFTGNNTMNLPQSYASSDFDQTHVFLINLTYVIPTFHMDKALSAVLNGWTVGSQIVAQSGQPYSIYDFSGSQASIYYSSNDEITNPIIGLVPGVTAKQAELQGTTGVNAAKPVLNVADFAPQYLAPGQDGVPAGDIYESAFANIGRNTFRGPFQSTVDVSIGKYFQITERMRLRFSADAFNLFNHPDFDTPNNDVEFFPDFGPPPATTPTGSLGIIQHTIGSPRFLQLNLHLTF